MAVDLEEMLGDTETGMIIVGSAAVIIANIMSGYFTRSSNVRDLVANGIAVSKEFIKQINDEFDGDDA